MPTTVATVTSNTSSLLSISSSIGSSELSPHHTSPSPQPLQHQHQNHHYQTNTPPLKTRSDLLAPQIGHVEHSQANRFSLGGNVSGTLSNNSRLPTDNQDDSRETHHQEEILTKNELSLMMKNRLRMGSTKQDYKFYQIIGRGSYGTVWKARSNHTKQVIAIKILDKNMIKNNGMMHHVRSELIIHLKMKHENIVELYHFFEDYTSIYMVMEYCKYNMLYHLQSKKKFSERRSRRYMRDIVAGLAHLHSHQIMHRDLKLANLLLTSDKVVKISDFGLSRYTKPNGECGTQLGTPKYMAYEVVLQKPYSQKADNWSLGCILYAFLEGRTPFHRDSETVEETFKLIQNMDFRIPDHLSFEAKDLISKLLERDPGKRISLSAVKRHNFFRSTSQEETIEEPVLNCFAMLTNLPEFNSSSLKAMSHRANDGKIQFELDREGLVHIILEGSSFVVSADSKDVWLTEKCTLGASKHYHRKELPKNLEHLYNYAYHFVEKVKSKTPSHIYNSSRGRCMLMQNEPKPDAEMIFYADGLRLVYNRKDHRILIHEANKPVKIVKLEKDLLEIVDSDVYKTPNCTRREQNCIADLKFGIEQCIFMIETKNQNRLSGVSDSIFSVTTNSTHSTDLSTPLDTTITSSVLDLSANTSTGE